MRILIIDDDAYLRRALARMLKQHAVTVAEGAGEALGIIRKGQMFDAILCDLHMPEMSGDTFCEEVSELLPELARRIIFISGGAFADGDEAFLASHRSLMKPFGARELESALAPLSAPPPPP
jgi:CheY-like chemotaxis protein